ncbi:hypothetical protein DM860_013102 [Cuscuta australis]|uniref:Rieske domain-containing protein n=1 Tax=Cuscuta australis TaxID=267555 RepID=A0A328DAT8_9ASTE|nr:hypothetical protein DM860_013102 [Cuscuta australis]
MRNPILENLLGLNLNLPPASRNPITPEMIVVNHEPIVGDNHIEYIMSSHYKELVELAIEGTSSMKEEELKFPITNSLIVGFHSKRQPALRAKRGSSIWYPGIYMQVSASIAPPLMPHINVDESAQSSKNLEQQARIDGLIGKNSPRSTVHVANEKPPFRALPLRPHYDFFFMAIDVVDKSSIVTTAADLESREEIDTLRGFEGILHCKCSCLPRSSVLCLLTALAKVLELNSGFLVDGLIEALTIVVCLEIDGGRETCDYRGGIHNDWVVANSAGKSPSNPDPNSSHTHVNCCPKVNSTCGKLNYRRAMSSSAISSALCLPFSRSSSSKSCYRKRAYGGLRVFSLYGDEGGLVDKKSPWLTLFNVEDPRSKVPQCKGKFLDVNIALEVARYDLQYCDWRARQDVLTIMLLHEKVVEVLNPLARDYKSIGTMKKELADLQEALAQAHKHVHMSEARVSAALDKLAYMESMVNDRLLLDQHTAEVGSSSPSLSAPIRHSENVERKMRRRRLNVSGPIQNYSDRLMNFWYPVAFSSDLKDDTMMPIDCFEQPWVIFRGNDRKPGCVQNTCAHRACPLHLGSVNDGRIQCPYHGWEYATDGKCEKMPSTRLLNVKLKTLPCFEQEGMIWIWPGNDPPEATIPSLKPPPGFQIHAEIVMELPVEHGLLLDNLLDLAHAPFTHTSTFAKGWSIPRFAFIDMFKTSHNMSS